MKILLVISLYIMPFVSFYNRFMMETHTVYLLRKIISDKTKEH